MKLSKTLIVLAVLILSAAQFSTDTFAQRRFVIPEGTDLNALIPGAYLRPITDRENGMVITSNVTGVASALTGISTVGFGAVSVFYLIEYKENTMGQDWENRGPANLQAHKTFGTVAVTCAVSTAALGVTSLVCKSMIRRKTIVKTATGGFVVEF